MTSPRLVAIVLPACVAYGLRPGTVLAVGACLLTEDGLVQVQEDGVLLPRPSPWPWTRPSVAAIPGLVVRG